MTEPTQPNEPAAPHRHSPHWWPALLCSAVFATAAIGYAYDLRGELLGEIKYESERQSDERKKLATRVDALQSNIETIAGQPKVDTDAISAQVTDTNSKLTALGDRLTALEKKPEPAPAPAPVVAPAAPANDTSALKLAASSGKPFSAELTAWEKQHPKANKQKLDPLAAVAESGIPSEAELNRALRDVLESAATRKPLDDTSLMGKLNTHLSGLVSIKKSADAGPYAKLHADVTREDIATLTDEVENLSEQDRKPFTDWLARAHARRDALAALNILDSAEAE